jgi:hypothetical protein
MESQANQGRREVGEGQHLNQDIFVPEEVGKGVEYPVQRDVRVDAMERQLENTDWSLDVRKAVLAFTQHTVDLSPIIRSQEPTGIRKLREILDRTSGLLADQVERRALEHLQETVNALEAFVRSETSPSGTKKYDEQEELSIARRALELAERASQAVTKEHTRKTLQLMCEVLETELGFAEEPMA